MNNSPAFPIHRIPRQDEHNHGALITERGMTLRDYFAAKAMQGILANPEFVKVLGNASAKAINISAMAYDQADAMLEARDE